MDLLKEDAMAALSQKSGTETSVHINLCSQVVYRLLQWERFLETQPYHFPRKLVITSRVQRATHTNAHIRFCGRSRPWGEERWIYVGQIDIDII